MDGDLAHRREAPAEAAWKFLLGTTVAALPGLFEQNQAFRLSKRMISKA
jgi:hypothetical protein